MNTKSRANGLHEQTLLAQAAPLVAPSPPPAFDPSVGPTTRFRYTFENHFHPFVGEIVAQINRSSVAEVMAPDWQSRLTNDFFPSAYESTGDYVDAVSFPKEFEIHRRGAYSSYNWELFFHLPLTIAVQLSKNRRFAEAQRWFHYIFDPTSTDANTAPPKRFWKFIGFRSDKTPAGLDDVLKLLSKPDGDVSEEERPAREDIINGYRDLLNRPFQPHAVARTRVIAYQYSVVMKYLDNLIAWGDDLFQQDTLESINEATQLYVLASNLLGPRPGRIPPVGAPRPKTFAQLEDARLSVVGNALVELESQFPFNLTSASQVGLGADAAAPLFGIGRAPYFCVPRNDKLLGYWDTVGDRLFKIRHCMNIQGVVRSLALFDPPIDPGLLVKASAVGIDINSVGSGLNPPVGPVRCQVLIQKALELCAEVRALGNAVLAAFERGDSERLALVRQGHEIRIQQMIQDARFLQWKSAEASTNSLMTSRATVLERLRYYQRLLGLEKDLHADELPNSDATRAELTEKNFDEMFATLVAQYDTPAERQDLPPLSTTGTLHLNPKEDSELNKILPLARNAHLVASAIETSAAAFYPIPEATAHYHFWGVGGSTEFFSGKTLAAAASSVAAATRMHGTWQQEQAGIASRTAAYERRRDEWLLQHNLAELELKQNGRQILTALIAEQAAHHDYLTLKQQIEDSREVSQFLQDKFTNADLSLWMQGETARLYYDYYRLAFDVARKAEASMKQELLRPELDAQDFVKFNYWDTGRKGLLAGEALQLDVKRMELAYLEHNKRELELTRHVSLRQLDPLALLALRATGKCEGRVPEWLYDKDCPGHYLRRIKSVAVTIPSVVGPYTSVNCTLTLLKSQIRKSPTLSDGQYARQGSDDARFIDYAGAVQSIVTSSALGDSGMFEANLRDERFLPFEGAGAISAWQLQLPGEYPAFDYDTISDVVIHIRYTARQGVEPAAVIASLKESLAGNTSDGPPLALLLSVPHDFPAQWADYVAGSGGFKATVRREHFPYFVQGHDIEITNLEIRAPQPTAPHSINSERASASLKQQGSFDIEVEAGILERTPGLEAFLVIRYSLPRA